MNVMIKFHQFHRHKFRVKYFLTSWTFTRNWNSSLFEALKYFGPQTLKMNRYSHFNLITLNTSYNRYWSENVLNGVSNSNASIKRVSHVKTILTQLG